MCPVSAHRQQVPKASSLAAEHRRPHCKQDECTSSSVVVVVITPPLPRDAGTARTAVQVHAVNLIEISLEERWQSI